MVAVLCHLSSFIPTQVVMGASAPGCGLSDLFSPMANSHPPQDLSWAEVKMISSFFIVSASSTLSIG